MDETLKALGINLNGLTYDELKPQEREYLGQMLSTLEKNEMTVEKIKEYLHQLRDVVEQELAKWDLKDKEDIFLKARLRNLMLLESFITSPERARKALQQQIKGVK